MKVVKPIAVTDTILTSSTIQEPDLSSGEVEWTNSGFAGFPVPNISNGEALTSNGSTYSIVGWNSSSLVATVYIFDSSFAFMSSKTFSAGSPYISGDKRDVCFDGSNYWFSNGDQLSMYDSNWDYAGTVINTDADFTNAYIQAVCSDGASLYVTMKDFTDSTYKIAKYTLSTGAFVESKEIQKNLANKIIGSTYRDGVIKHFARRDYDDEPIYVYETSVDLVGFENIGTVDSLDPSSDIGLESISSGYITLNETLEKVNKYKQDYNLQGLYQVEDRAIKTTNHKLYQCAIETKDDPVDGVVKVPPTWVEVGPTNKWAMFDYKKSTQSKPSGQLDVELTFTNTLDSVSVFDMESVDTVKIIATSASSGEVFNKTYNVSMDIDLVVLDIPPFDDLTLNLTFTGTDMLIGEVVVGHSKELGVLLSGVVSDRIDYSRTKYDDFGELEYVPRPLVRYTTYPVRISKANAPSIERYLDALKGTQAVWVGDIGNGDLITTFGNIERSPMTYDNPSIVEYQIKVRGSI